MHELQVAQLVSAAPRPWYSVIERWAELDRDALVHFAFPREAMAAERAQAVLLEQK